MATPVTGIIGCTSRDPQVRKDSISAQIFGNERGRAGLSQANARKILATIRRKMESGCSLKGYLRLSHVMDTREIEFERKTWIQMFFQDDYNEETGITLQYLFMRASYDGGEGIIEHLQAYLELRGPRGYIQTEEILNFIKDAEASHDNEQEVQKGRKKQQEIQRASSTENQKKINNQFHEAKIYWEKLPIGVNGDSLIAYRDAKKRFLESFEPKDDSNHLCRLHDTKTQKEFVSVTKSAHVHFDHKHELLMNDAVSTCYLRTEHSDAGIIIPEYVKVSVKIDEQDVPSEKIIKHDDLLKVTSIALGKSKKSSNKNVVRVIQTISPEPQNAKQLIAVNDECDTLNQNQVRALTSGMLDILEALAGGSDDSFVHGDITPETIFFDQVTCKVYILTTQCFQKISSIGSSDITLLPPSRSITGRSFSHPSLKTCLPNESVGFEQDLFSVGITILHTILQQEKNDRASSFLKKLETNSITLSQEATPKSYKQEKYIRQLIEDYFPKTISEDKSPAGVALRCIYASFQKKRADDGSARGYEQLFNREEQISLLRRLRDQLPLS